MVVVLTALLFKQRAAPMVALGITHCGIILVLGENLRRRPSLRRCW
jgi:hypothetical protein